MNGAPLPYRPCVGIVLLNERQRVFVGQRTDGAGGPLAAYWQMPQGGIDEGEDPLSAAKRELFEETNVSSVTVLADYPGWLTYDLPPELVGTALKGKYRGQTQKWFVFRFTGTESEINIHRPGNGVHKAEFSSWMWAELSDLPALAVPFKKDIYETLRAFAAKATLASVAF